MISLTAVLFGLMKVWKQIISTWQLDIMILRLRKIRKPISYVWEVWQIWCSDFTKSGNRLAYVWQAWHLYAYVWQVWQLWFSDFVKSENMFGIHDNLDRCDFRTFLSPKICLTGLTVVIFGFGKVRTGSVYMTILTYVIFGLS